MPDVTAEQLAKVLAERALGCNERWRELARAFQVWLVMEEWYGASGGHCVEVVEGEEEALAERTRRAEADETHWTQPGKKAPMSDLRRWYISGPHAVLADDCSESAMAFRHDELSAIFDGSPGWWYDPNDIVTLSAIATRFGQLLAQGEAS